MYLRTGPHCGCYHLTIIQPKQDKITPYLDMVQDDCLMPNSTMEDCFTGRSQSVEALQMHTQSDFLTPETFLCCIPREYMPFLFFGQNKETQTFIKCSQKDN